MAQTKIEWTDATWNPVTGCTKISAGCLNCYAEKMARRLYAMGQVNYRNGFSVTCHEHMLDRPLRWKTGKHIFVNSMSDLFHDSISDEYIYKIFDVMNKASWHTYQILTKRIERAAKMGNKLPWSPNIWIGTTVEHRKYCDRIRILAEVESHKRFLSFEPLLSAMPNLQMSGIDWVIVGGESGPSARPVQYEWIEDIRLQCELANIPFFFKQWGGTNKKLTGRMLNGRIYDAIPVF